MYKTSTITITLGALAGGLSTAGAQVMCGDIITTSEVLTSNLNCETSPGLTVQGPGGNLDMRDFTLACVGTTASTADGIRLEGQGAIVQNGTVTGCQDGVGVGLTGGHRVRRMILRNNSADGLLTNTRSSANQITESIAHGNGKDGFDTSTPGSGPEGGNNLVSQNIATSNGEDGFDTDHNNTFTSNVARGNARDGFIVFDPGNSLRQNVALNNGGSGFHVLNFATDNTLTQNSGLRNTNFDLQDDTPNCDNNTWRGNVGTRNQPCIR